VKIAHGRDAVDVALSTAYGAAGLTSMVVWADEIAEGEQPAQQSEPLTVPATRNVSAETISVSEGISSGGGSADHATSDSWRTDAEMASAPAGG
jgi:hypothetical protein